MSYSQYLPCVFPASVLKTFILRSVFYVLRIISDMYAYTDLGGWIPHTHLLGKNVSPAVFTKFCTSVPGTAVFHTVLVLLTP